jgi:hypothetical protein
MIGAKEIGPPEYSFQPDTFELKSLARRGPINNPAWVRKGYLPGKRSYRPCAPRDDLPCLLSGAPFSPVREADAGTAHCGPPAHVLSLLWKPALVRGTT